MVKLHTTSTFGGYARDWDGVFISEISDYELVSLTAARGQAAAFAKAVKKALGCALPAPGTSVQAGDGCLIWTGQGQYLAMINGENDRADEPLAKTLGASGYAVLQSDGWGALDVFGNRALDVFDRFIPLNLRKAADNFAARTSAHHMAVIVVKRQNDAWHLLTPRTSAAGFLESLEHVVDNVVGEYVK